MIRLLTRRGVQMALLMALLLIATWSSGTERPWLQRLQYITFDTFNKIKPRAPTDSVVIVDIDEDSLAALGQWPWPRDVMAKLVENLKADQAATIAFDVVFAEADRTDPSLLAKRLPDTPEAAPAKSVLQSMPDNDEVFAKAVKDAGNVVTGFVWATSGNAGKVPATPRGMVIAKPARDMLMQNAVIARHMVTNLPVLQAVAAGNGSFSVSTDGDGIVRRVPLVVKFTPDNGGAPQLYPSLSLEALRVALGGKDSVQIMPTKAQSLSDLLKPALQIKIGSLRIPVNDDGQIWVYYTPEKKDRYIPAWQVIAGTVDKSKIAGRIVMVGTSAEGLKDIRSSPLNLFVPGVEMHVNIIEQALQGKFIARPALATGIEAVFIFATGLLVILLTPFVNLFFLFASMIALIFGAFALSWKAYTQMGVLVDPVYPSMAVLVMFIVSSLLSYLKSETERREIRGAFGLYISPDFMKELTKNPGKLKLGGEIKTLSIMFTDIRNFTTIAEGMTPQVLINTMNDFLTPMSDEVMKARGTIDKYMGDAMMAFWNAPLDVADHERLAVDAALKMREVLAPINARLKSQAEAEGRPFYPLNCGIGLNTGPVAVGNMGSRQRFAYSVLGDAVNLASRLEGQTKTYGVDILMGEATADKVKDYALAEIDLIRVKGKEQPVRIYTVLGGPDKAQDLAFRTFQGLHNAFLAAYRARDFEGALRHLKACRNLDVADRLGDYYMVFELRIADFQKNTPPQNWDGVYAATGK
jgi:adenylate cyclase